MLTLMKLVANQGLLQSLLQGISASQPAFTAMVQHQTEHRRHCHHI